jgi:hypothetical protein
MIKKMSMMSFLILYGTSSANINTGLKKKEGCVMPFFQVYFYTIVG